MKQPDKYIILGVVSIYLSGIGLGILITGESFWLWISGFVLVIVASTYAMWLYKHKLKGWKINTVKEEEGDASN